MKEKPEDRSRIMRAVRGRDTVPELTVRRMVHGMGYRYGLHGRNLPGKPDLVFARRRKVVFVHGCFWHGHECTRGARVPVHNRAYWEDKIARNKARDTSHLAALRRKGWRVLIIWECELRNRDRISRRLMRFLC